MAATGSVEAQTLRSVGTQQGRKRQRLLLQHANRLGMLPLLPSHTPLSHFLTPIHTLSLDFKRGDVYFHTLYCTLLYIILHCTLLYPLPHPLPGESRWLPPCCICGLNSDKWCIDCGVAFCGDDYDKEHVSDERKNHQWSNLETEKEPLKPGEIHCCECKKRVAKVYQHINTYPITTHTFTPTHNLISPTHAFHPLSHPTPFPIR